MQTQAKRLVIKYLELQARRLLARYHPKIVAVAGSVGKTSTKLAIAAVLSQRYKVLAHASSYNSAISLPLAIFDLRVPDKLYNPLAWVWLLVRISLKYHIRYPYDIVVLELGTDQPGDIAYFMRYIKPEIGVITAVTPEHMQGFGSMEAVLEEEFLLATHSQHVLLNAGDVMLSVKKRELQNRSIQTFGIEKGDYRFQIGSHGLDGIQGQLHLKDKSSLRVHLKILAKQTLYGVTAAAAVGDLLKLGHNLIKEGVEEIKPVPGRMNLLLGINHSLIIDDSYNSSPDAAIAALDTLYSLSAKRKLAILGSMNELGSYSAEAHRNLGQWCSKLDYLVTVGSEAKRYLVPAAMEAGLDQSKINSFDSPYTAGKFLKSKIRKGDLILAKGSQNLIYIEEAIKYLLADQAIKDRLVRQSNFWQDLKAKQFKLEQRP